MKSKIMGFLTLKGWAGVVNIGILVAIGTIIGISLLYFFLIYQKEPKPKRISLKFLIIEAILMMTLLIMVISL